MPIARGLRPLKLVAALAVLAALSVVGTTLPAHPPPATDPQSPSADAPQQDKQPQSPNAAGTTSKPTPPDAAVASASPTIKADLKKAKQADKQGLRAQQQGDWQAAYEAYVDAVNWAPHDADYFAQREVAKSHVVQMKVDLAERHAVSGEIPAALRTLREARELDPSNRIIRERLVELAALDPSQAKRSFPVPRLRPRCTSNICPENKISTCEATHRRPMKR